MSCRGLPRVTTSSTTPDPAQPSSRPSSTHLLYCPALPKPSESEHEVLCQNQKAHIGMRGNVLLSGRGREGGDLAGPSRCIFCCVQGCLLLVLSHKYPIATESVNGERCRRCARTNLVSAGTQGSWRRIGCRNSTTSIWLGCNLCWSSLSRGTRPRLASMESSLDAQEPHSSMNFSVAVCFCARFLQRITCHVLFDTAPTKQCIACIALLGGSSSRICLRCTKAWTKYQRKYDVWCIVSFYYVYFVRDRCQYAVL